MWFNEKTLKFKGQCIYCDFVKIDERNGNYIVWLHENEHLPPSKHFQSVNPDLLEKPCK
tara:strand:- start:11364 stop:11540 length:177 start_codon:yes stop_codon:yes gene_type:complete